MNTAPVGGPAGKKMAIIASYFSGEHYGLLGPQIAATIIEEHTGYECIVIAVARDDDKALLKIALSEYFGKERPIIGFSILSGRPDLFALANELRNEGADSPGVLSPGKGGGIIHIPGKAWDENLLKKVNWGNLRRMDHGRLTPHEINTGQVLQQIGCPYASRSRRVEVDYPASLPGKSKVRLLSKGCSFCDVATDKGFYGALPEKTVLGQIRSLPETKEGRKIAFELINENAPPALPRLLALAQAEGFQLSQINLTLRADWLVKGEPYLKSALRSARGMGIKILVTAVGFESFDDRILANLNKGVTVKTNLEAIRLMRRLKEEFPDAWGYTREEGAVHGFIHPTPWDTPTTMANTQETIHLYGLQKDILPSHSVPLIIHHASALGDWIREIEAREHIRFKREASIIGWWQIGDRFTL
ncbi:MAG: hypothetical protein P8175_10440 [Deltaproteobacteria bacterium]